MTGAFSLPRVTPTELAEERYAMTQRARAKQVKEADATPSAKALYRMTLDQMLLGKLARAAYAAEEERVLAPAARKRVEAALVADLALRFPVDDMVVLQKYRHGCAYPTIIVETPGGQPTRFDLDEPRWLPPQGCRFTARDAGTPVVPRVPAETEKFFEQLGHLRAQAREVPLLCNWPGQFKATHGRAPRWAEIEQHWPILGRYLADRRAGEVA